MSLGHHRMGDIDPSNILEPGTARITRGVPPQRLRSTPGNKKGSGEDDDLASLDGSPVIKVELSALASPVSDSSTSPGEGDYEETPVNEGRHLQLVWQGRGSPFAPAVRSVSSDNLENDSVDVRNSKIINVHQEVERYANDHSKDFNWSGSIYTEYACVLAMVEALRTDAKDSSDVALVEDMDLAINKLAAAKDKWCNLACITTPITPEESVVSGIRRLSSVQSLDPAHARGSELCVDQNDPPSLEDGMEPVVLFDPVFVNRELTATEQVNRSVELSSVGTDNTWLKVCSFCIEVPSFPEQFSTDSPIFEELKKYEEKVHRCIEGISHTLRSHAQVHADHAQRLAKLEENSAQTEADATQAAVKENSSQLHKLKQFVDDTVYPGFLNVGSGLQEVRDSLMIYVGQLLDRDTVLDTSVNTVSARIDEVAKMVQNVGLANELVGTTPASQVESVESGQESMQAAETVPTETDITSEVPVADQRVADRLEVGGATSPSVPTTDPISSATDKDCDQPMGSRLEVSGATVPTTDPVPNADSCDNVGNQPSEPKSVSQRQIQVENDIQNEEISINAIISTQFPSGIDELCPLDERLTPKLDRCIDRITLMLADWKKRYAGSDSTVFDNGLYVARAAQKWALDLELACELAYRFETVCDLPEFTDQLDMPVEKYFEKFDSWFGVSSSWLSAHKLMTRYLDPGLQIDMVEIGYDFQGAKEYLICRFKKVPTCPVPVFVTDPESSSTPLSGNDPKSSQDWYDPTLMKPCPLKDHGHHEVGTCLDFLSFSPRDRRDAIFYNICTTCLDPLARCRAITGSHRCGNEVTFRPMACKECKDSSNKDDIPCMNALICYNKLHKKMTKAEVLKIAPHVFPGFGKASSEALI